MDAHLAAWRVALAAVGVDLEVWREVLVTLAPHGWLVPWSYTPREAAEMLDMYRRHGLEAVEARLIEDFRELSATKAVAMLAHEPVLTEWLPVLTMAASAHDRGEWPLAIPVWLIATEDLIRQVGINYSIRPGSHEAQRAQEVLAPSGSIAPRLPKRS